ncbi:MAG: type II secretion system F family protein [Actinomycetota bacterium]
MPLFRFRAVDEAGQTVDGEVEADDLAAVVERQRRQGRLVLKAEPAGTGRGRLAAALSRDLLVARQPSAREVALMLRELAILLKAGLPLERALTVIASLAGRTRGARIAADLLGRVRSGSTLADAMQAHGAVFPGFAVGMIRAGEAAGALAVVASRLAELMERSLAMKDGLVSALIYPAVLVGAAGATVALLVGVVLPQFRPLFEQAGHALPLATRMVLAAADAAQAWWWLAPLLVLAVVAVVLRRRTDAAFRLRVDRAVLVLPFAGRLAAEIETARLLRGLGTLVANGVPLHGTLSILRTSVGNAAVAEAVAEAADALKEGRPFAEPLARRPWFPAVAARLLAVGDETGRLADMAARAAELLDMRVERTTQRGLALLGPVMTLSLGLLVAGVIAAILLAILGVNDLAL